MWTQAPVEQNRIALPLWMKGLRQQAEEHRDQLLPVSEAQLAVALAKASGSAGMGCDQWQVARWKQLDAEGRTELLAVLHQVEDELAWPVQTLLVQMAKLPKPAGGAQAHWAHLSIVPPLVWSAQSGGVRLGGLGQEDGLLGHCSVWLQLLARGARQGGVG